MRQSSLSVFIGIKMWLRIVLASSRTHFSTLRLTLNKFSRCWFVNLANMAQRVFLFCLIFNRPQINLKEKALTLLYLCLFAVSICLQIMVLLVNELCYSHNLLWFDSNMFCLRITKQPTRHGLIIIYYIQLGLALINSLDQVKG